MASYDLRTGYELLSSQPDNDREGEDTDDQELAPLAANVIHVAPGSTRRKIFCVNKRCERSFLTF